MLSRIINGKIVPMQEQEFTLMLLPLYLHPVRFVTVVEIANFLKDFLFW